MRYVDLMGRISWQKLLLNGLNITRSLMVTVPLDNNRLNLPVSSMIGDISPLVRGI